MEEEGIIKTIPLLANAFVADRRVNKRDRVNIRDLLM